MLSLPNTDAVLSVPARKFSYDETEYNDIDAAFEGDPLYCAEYAQEITDYLQDHEVGGR